MLSACCSLQYFNPATISSFNLEEDGFRFDLTFKPLVLVPLYPPLPQISSRVKLSKLLKLEKGEFLEALNNILHVCSCWTYFWVICKSLHTACSETANTFWAVWADTRRWNEVWCSVLSASPSLALFLHHINQGVIHAYLFLLLSVHPFCLPPLAFIRTVDGESRTHVRSAQTQALAHIQSVAICDGKRRHMCYIYRLSRSCFAVCLMCFIVWKHAPPEWP